MSSVPGRPPDRARLRTRGTWSSARAHASRLLPLSLWGAVLGPLPRLSLLQQLLGLCTQGRKERPAIPPQGSQEPGLASQENHCPKRLPLRNQNNSGSGSRAKSSSPVSAGPSQQPGRLGRWGRLGAWTVLLTAPAPQSCPWRGASGSKYHPHPTVWPIF